MPCFVEAGGESPMASNAVCGNSVLEIGETCDDGNTTSGDGCSFVCQTEDSSISQIVFSAETSDGKHISVINSDGTGLTDLTDKTGNSFCPVWSPDGSRIAYCSIQTGDVNTSLYIMNADGSNVSKIKEISGERCDEVEWSPDGTMLAYVTASGPLSPTYKAYKINVDGTGLVNLGAIAYFNPVWSSDGTKIFMAESPVTGGKLTSIHPDGTGLAVLTQFRYFPKEVSPDGTKMLFGGGEVPASEIVGGGIGTKSGLFNGNSNGSGSYTMIFENVDSPQELYCDWGCSWSPDGAKIVYDKYLSGSGMNIYIANLDGSGETLLVKDARDPDWR